MNEYTIEQRSNGFLVGLAAGTFVGAVGAGFAMWFGRGVRNNVADRVARGAREVERIAVAAKGTNSGHKFLVGSLICLTLLSVSTFAEAQPHAVTPAALAAEVLQHTAQQDADRMAIHDVLASPQARDIAAKAGLDLDRANSFVDTLSGSSLEQAAAAAHQANQSLVGGSSTVVISTTTIIIILLVILLIFAVK
jgi:hypothetical protein